MTNKVKMILIILVAITLAGVGYFIVFKSKNKPQPPVNTAPKTEEIDTSDWRVYRSEVMGFEIKMPKGWVKRFEDIGPQPNDEDEFWRDQVGAVEFIPSYQKGFPQFKVTVKDSNLTLEGFARRVGFGREESTLVNNFQVIRYFLDGRKDKQPNYREALLIKNNDRYYYFEFSASDDFIDNDIIIWNKIISAFKPLD